MKILNNMNICTNWKRLRKESNKNEIDDDQEKGEKIERFKRNNENANGEKEKIEMLLHTTTNIGITQHD